MDDYGRRIVIDLGFEAAVAHTAQAIREAGLDVVSRIDVRDCFWRDLRHGFRQYVLLDVWSPTLAIEALKHDLAAGTILRTTFAVYELADGETAIVAREPLSSVSSDPGWRRDTPALALIADRLCNQIAGVLARLQHPTPQPASGTPAA